MKLIILIIWAIIDHVHINRFFLLSPLLLVVKTSRTESMVCNPPESTCQSLMSNSSSQSSKTSTSSTSVKENKSSNNTSSYDQITTYRDFYTTPVSALDPETYSKYRTLRSMVVSQTWLTGWIKELYNIESDIVSATGKTL